MHENLFRDLRASEWDKAFARVIHKRKQKMQTGTKPIELEDEIIRLQKLRAKLPGCEVTD